MSANWDRYETLFGSKERVELLNAGSSLFWHAMQGILHEHVLLGICRLTDPAGRGTRRNLSVERLYEVDPTDTKSELAIKVKLAVRKAEFARSWRDKRIAHNDLGQITGAASLLSPSTSANISEAIVAIHSVLKWIHRRYFAGDLILVSIGDGDANEMMLAMARAKFAHDEEITAIEAGDWAKLDYLSRIRPPDDYRREKRYAPQADTQQPEQYFGKLPLQT